MLRFAVFIIFYLFQSSVQVPAIENGTVEICNTNECIRTAEVLKKSMKLEIDPCDDFYEYVCGNYPKDHLVIPQYKMSSWAAILTMDVQKKISTYLTQKNEPQEPKAVHKVRDFYTSCMDTATMDLTGLDNLASILKKVGLTSYPPIFNVNKNFNWMETASKIQKLTGDGPLFTIDIGRDFKDETKNRIRLYRGTQQSQILGLTELNAKNGGNSDLNAYLEKVMDIMSNHSKIDTTTSEYKKLRKSGIAKIFFNLSLSMLMGGTSSSSKQMSMTLSELQNYTTSGTKEQFKWSEYVQSFFKDVKDVEIDVKNEIILVPSPVAIRNMGQIVNSCLNGEIELYLWFSLVNILSPYANEQLRSSSSASLLSSVAQGSTRDVICLDLTNKVMGTAVSSYFATDPKFQETKRKVTNMVKHIRYAFTKIVDEADWMEDATKVITKQKEEKMGLYAAFPDWLTNSTILDQDYLETVIDKQNFIETWTNEHERRMLKKLATLRLPNIGMIDTVGIEPIKVNAFYSPDYNTMVVPAAILDFPFHQNGLESMNYGGIGAIIGHEITHGFDNKGRLYNEDGIVEQWWDNNTLKAYEKRTNCFIDYYNNCTFEGQKVNGKKTLDENIADNGGLREAWIAYKQYMLKQGQEPALPGFEKFSQEKLFSISYAHMYCQNIENTKSVVSSLLSAVHTPNAARVRAVLGNWEEFGNIWGCKKGTKMNSDDRKCRIW